MNYCVKKCRHINFPALGIRGTVPRTLTDNHTSAGKGFIQADKSRGRRMLVRPPTPRGYQALEFSAAHSCQLASIKRESETSAQQAPEHSFELQV